MVHNRPFEQDLDKTYDEHQKIINRIVIPLNSTVKKQSDFDCVDEMTNPDTRTLEYGFKKKPKNRGKFFSIENSPTLRKKYSDFEEDLKNSIDLTNIKKSFPTAKSISPQKMRYTVYNHAPSLKAFSRHMANSTAENTSKLQKQGKIFIGHKSPLTRRSAMKWGKVQQQNPRRLQMLRNHKKKLVFLSKEIRDSRKLEVEVCAMGRQKRADMAVCRSMKSFAKLEKKQKKEGHKRSVSMVQFRFVSHKKKGKKRRKKEMMKIGSLIGNDIRLAGG
jgi:hypothetical protein